MARGVGAALHAAQANGLVHGTVSDDGEVLAVCRFRPGVWSSLGGEPVPAAAAGHLGSAGRPVRADGCSWYR